ncbi:cocE [Symbiodinium pilosum]|uniref:CocE protein n=1 Tax=Symbiodinium pilosum TaxID=2952 RepID=A0A812WVH5_SYMPI|nr:cocE [Symbiodinium pilosum]
MGSEVLGLSDMVLKDREKGFKPRCEFTVTSIDTAMVEGVVLRGSLLLPKGLEGPFPSVLMRTPYGRKTEMGQSFLARQGYAVLVQDTRGRFSSSGEFVPVQHEQMDGAATVAWMRQQPWCNGKVGATGGSYLGFTAWACVDGFHLDAIVPIITQSNIRSAVFRPGGAVSFELVVLWFYLVLHLMKDLHEDPLSLPKKLWNGMRERKLRRAFKSLPLGKVDEIILGSQNAFLQDGLSAHGNEASRFWEGKDKLCSFERPIPPCHILTGWYDFFLEGALEDFAKAQSKGNQASLTIAPIHHWSLLGFRAAANSRLS